MDVQITMDGQRNN